MTRSNDAQSDRVGRGQLRYVVRVFRVNISFTQNSLRIGAESCS